MAYRSLFAPLACACALISTGANAETIRLVQDNVYAPYMTGDADGASGLWADVINEALTRVGDDYDVSLEAMPWARAVKMVENDQAHGLVGTYHKPVSRPWLGTYSTEPYNESVSVFCREGVAQSDWDYPHSFRGLTFGNVNGSGAPGTEFFAMAEAGDLKVENAHSSEINIKKMAAGRIDCFVQERLVAEIAINAVGATNIEYVLDASSERAMIGYRGTWTGDVAEGFIAAMNSAIEEMKADGTIDKLVASVRGS